MRRLRLVESRRVIKVFLLGAILALFVGIFTSCSNGDSNGVASGDAETTSESSIKTIGIVQIMEHPSLNTIRESFIKQLADEGYHDGENIKIDYQNAQSDQTNLKTICQKFANNNYDLIVAIATPSAQAAAGETKEIPVLFAACTDPVSAGLVESLDKPGGNVTGTSDAVSAEQIMELAQRITPDIKTIGALYNSGEANSVSVISNLKDYASRNGMTVVEATVINTSEVQQAAQTLAEKADILFSPIDNTVASAMPVVAQVTKAAKKPIYVGADSMVKDGGMATYGVNYQVLGQETAKMAIEILDGKKPADMPVMTMDAVEIYLNKDTAAAIGTTFPEDVVKEAKQVFGK
ncbi:MAG: ABC transporter substrate-binding protein [Syntrophaceticus sp.]|jgi:putative ABC transport system substrate-binding protein|nr:ABC transporter substrate-binding protein [Syntrophaceticus sp.]MDD3315472.1 ABC transporter substrate-binding protein [Syntrophaceticus sp.]MDD4360520.1 ABC transporter substrate-binding protein [Syntrophaceticus sp.]MDD4783570.1 ABC transporter substrate-binding protein [Syntrophaceticus sp.]